MTTNMTTIKNLLSGKELVAERAKECPLLNRGLKKTIPDNSAEEQNALSGLYDSLHQLLSARRIERVIKRSRATFDQENKLIIVTRKLGKWNTFGYYKNYVHCLHYYEALYLIEINRLELYFNSVIVSLQQAYYLLLNSDNQELYLVYSQLSKHGYIVQPYDPDLDVPKIVEFKYKKVLSLQEKCIWRCLYKSINHKLIAPDDSIDNENETYRRIQESMSSNAEKIKQQNNCSNETIPDGSNWNCIPEKSLKRKSTTPADEHIAKKSKNEYKPETCLDILLDESDLSGFKDIFKEIQIIDLKESPVDNDQIETLNLDFNLYFANSNFKQSAPGHPNYRIIVRKADGPAQKCLLPSRQSIVKCFLKQAYRAPIIVVFVNDTMSLNGFVYRFSI